MPNNRDKHNDEQEKLRDQLSKLENEYQETQNELEKIKQELVLENKKENYIRQFQTILNDTAHLIKQKESMERALKTINEMEYFKNQKKSAAQNHSLNNDHEDYDENYDKNFKEFISQKAPSLLSSYDEDISNPETHKSEIEEYERGASNRVTAEMEEAKSQKETKKSLMSKIKSSWKKFIDFIKSFGSKSNTVSSENKIADRKNRVSHDSIQEEDESHSTVLAGAYQALADQQQDLTKKINAINDFENKIAKRGKEDFSRLCKKINDDKNINFNTSNFSFNESKNIHQLENNVQAALTNLRPTNERNLYGKKTKIIREEQLLRSELNTLRSEIESVKQKLSGKIKENQESASNHSPKTF